MKTCDDLYELLSDPELSLTRRMKRIKGVFDKDISDEMLALLCILSEEIDLKEFCRILGDFRNILEDEHIISRGIVYSVEPLDEDTIEDLTLQVEKLTGKDCLLVNRIDKSVLGGVLISVDGKLIDLSLRKRMEDLRLAAGGAAEASGRGSEDD